MKVFTAQDIVNFLEARGGYWFLTLDGDLVIHDTNEPRDDEMYLMSWDAAWFAQWNDDWANAAEQLNETLERTLQELRGN
ncbi:hypothetical protein SEA_VINE_27 [Gordonia phage Vine]|uniref:Uncharacterized protein n=1 Tax=Gordonia phage Vine TaxID=2857501 RepID=A0AAE7XBQ5_9CAUD|nr:hypothetical protein PP998_gp27 [Gordonia phage Vine]QZD97736.1 hypothetical protein SEA_VINE_27 [Gordonia phage Vine]